MSKEFIGKRIKIVDYAMEYGMREKFMNILCFFRCISDNSLYVIGVDDYSISAGIIYYGKVHVRENSLILIGNKDPNLEVVKDIVNKLDKGDELINYEIKSLDEIDDIELVSPNKMEFKKEIIDSLFAKYMPKEDELENNNNSKGKIKIIPILLLLIIVGGIGYFVFVKDIFNEEEEIGRVIMCKKNYPSLEIAAEVIEDNSYNFNYEDSLEFVNKLTTYKFYREDDYLNFINNGEYYSYIDSVDGGFTLDDDNYSLIVIKKEDVEVDYFLPIEYDEVLNYYSAQGYSCSEKVEE